jgi:hypothetical protein
VGAADGAEPLPGWAADLGLKERLDGDGSGALGESWEGAGVAGGQAGELCCLLLLLLE